MESKRQELRNVHFATVADIEALYGQPAEVSAVKEVARITPQYRAYIGASPFAVEDKVPRSVMAMTVDAVHFQCARALVRSELWNPARHVDPKSLPSGGQILAALSQHRVGGKTYDREWSGRAARTIW